MVTNGYAVDFIEAVAEFKMPLRPLQWKLEQFVFIAQNDAFRDAVTTRAVGLVKWTPCAAGRFKTLGGSGTSDPPSDATASAIACLVCLMSTIFWCVRLACLVPLVSVWTW